MNVFSKNTSKPFGLASADAEDKDKKCGFFCRAFKSKWLKVAAGICMVVPGMQAVGLAIGGAIASYELAVDQGYIEPAWRLTESQYASQLDTWMDQKFMPWFQLFANRASTAMSTTNRAAAIVLYNDLFRQMCSLVAHFDRTIDMDEESRNARLGLIKEALAPIEAELRKKIAAAGMGGSIQNIAFSTSGISTLVPSSPVTSISCYVVSNKMLGDDQIVRPNNPVVISPDVQPMPATPGIEQPTTDQPTANKTKSRLPWLIIAGLGIYILARKK